jgi:hypothetical protein
MDNRGVNISTIYSNKTKSVIVALSYRPFYNADDSSVVIENTNIGDESGPISNCSGLGGNTLVGDLKYYSCTRAGDSSGTLWINIKERPAVSVEIPGILFEGKPLYSIATDGPIPLPDNLGGGIAEVIQDGVMVRGTRTSEEFTSQFVARYTTPVTFRGTQARVSRADGCQVITDQFGTVTGKRKYCVDAFISSSSELCDLSRNFHQRTCIDGNVVTIEKYQP